MEYEMRYYDGHKKIATFKGYVKDGEVSGVETYHGSASNYESKQECNHIPIENFYNWLSATHSYNWCTCARTFKKLMGRKVENQIGYN